VVPSDRKLETIRLNDAGLRTYYILNIQTAISFAAPSCYALISDTNKQKLIFIHCIVTDSKQNKIYAETSAEQHSQEFNFEESLIVLDDFFISLITT
jgi:hypothetical protein